MPSYDQIAIEFRRYLQQNFTQVPSKDSLSKYTKTIGDKFLTLEFSKKLGVGPDDIIAILCILSLSDPSKVETLKFKRGESLANIKGPIQRKVSELEDFQTTVNELLALLKILILNSQGQLGD